MERTKNFFVGIAFSVLLFLPINRVLAQTQTQEEPNLTREEVKVINTERKLVADNVNTKLEAATIDSLMVLLGEEEENEEDMSSVDELYDGIWNNQYVSVYSGVAIPDSFRINLLSFVMPIKGKINSPFGPRGRRFHYGTDLKLQVGDTVVAAFEGKVRVSRYEKRGYGYFLVLRHPNGLETVYGHLSKFLVEEGDSVSAGQPIALGGNTGRSTGSHLHFECRFLGQAIDPADIIDLNNFCTYDDYYVFEKSKIDKISVHNIHYFANKYTSPKGSFTYHRVKAGDTLATIAKKYKVPISQLCRLNGINQTTHLKVGKVLRCS